MRVLRLAKSCWQLVIISSQVDWTILVLELPDADVLLFPPCTFYLGHGEWLVIPKPWLDVGLH
jgi:hypothetical protein